MTAYDAVEKQNSSLFYCLQATVPVDRYSEFQMSPVSLLRQRRQSIHYPQFCALDGFARGARRLFKKKYRRSDGEPYCRLSYELQVENTESGLMKYSLLIEAREYSAVDAIY
ncbi:hypothetical protein Z517_12505 [Fonsecaea pedrosoi CBS 271.37]|uniref:Uncharacterized protein n=1 Tax=Fonsecaea pedrosoi CBS 271.37 TaxID=1442368 RepID=A0A0D2G5S7_9EURO|nr:uncharacterized protein Z517_12505 [Fonsecaea pedrosoi CBS 271.37]KIW74095.1 hypothetical protein Z517_12505 [Fonsecaea pedrosoi CBS 271.37]